MPQVPKKCAYNHPRTRVLGLEPQTLGLSLTLWFLALITYMGHFAGVNTEGLRRKEQAVADGIAVNADLISSGPKVSVSRPYDEASVVAYCVLQARKGCEDRRAWTLRVSKVAQRHPYGVPAIQALDS